MDGAIHDVMDGETGSVSAALNLMFSPIRCEMIGDKSFGNLIERCN